jgi:hypothetical protein
MACDRYDMIGYDMIWYIIWYNTTWHFLCNLMWCDMMIYDVMIWYDGMIWYMIYGMILYDMRHDICDKWYDTWYGMIYMIYDVVWYMIRYDMLWYIWYDKTYLLTAFGLTPGGSSTVHIYTQTVHRTTQWNRIDTKEHT